MSMLGINGNVEWGKDHTKTQSWSHRKLATDAAVEPIEPLNKKDGWPWEYVIQLCNEADMDRRGTRCGGMMLQTCRKSENLLAVGLVRV